MSQLSDFLIFCAGSENELLKKCTTPEIAKHQSIGATIFFTAFFAMMSGGYALSSVFHEGDYQSIIIVVFLAFTWGLFIFNLDRYIVSSMVKQEGLLGDLKLTVPRLILAIFLAIVISTPLELKIFEDRIDNQLVADAQQVYQDQEESIRQKNIPKREELANRTMDIKEKKQELNEKKQELITFKEQKQAKLDKLRKEWKLNEELANEQLLGNPDKNILSGKGSQYRRYKRLAKEAKQKYEVDEKRFQNYITNEQAKTNELEQSIIQLEKQLNIDKAELESTQKGEIDTIKGERGKYEGFAERIEAFSHLKSKSDAVWYTYLFITLLFIAIETAPVFIKMLSGEGTYDKLLKERNDKIISGEEIFAPLPPVVQSTPEKDIWREQYEETIRKNTAKPNA